MRELAGALAGASGRWQVLAVWLADAGEIEGARVDGAGKVRKEAVARRLGAATGEPRGTRCQAPGCWSSA